MQYALLRYTTTNLGDEIQSIAARQFLPSVDILVERDRPNRLPEGASGPYKIVFNGWHTHGPENWPPSPDLDPLLISIHITNDVHSASTSRLRPADVLLDGANLDYLRAHGPVGARDLWTRDLLRSKGVESYFSGCMTLTLGSGEARPRGDYVCAVDLDKPALKRLRGEVRGRIVTTTHEYPPAASFAERTARAEHLLSLYAHARCVVTTRLHCALPCLALGTPVLFVVSARDTYRFSGLKDLVRNCTPEEYLKGGADFDPNDPSPNDDAYRALRLELTCTVNRFIDPLTADADTVPHPFTPAPDIDALFGAEQTLPPGDTDTRTRRIFSRLFKWN